MDIKEIKKKKKILEDSICLLINKFEEETEVNIDDVDFGWNMMGDRKISNTLKVRILL